MKTDSHPRPLSPTEFPRFSEITTFSRLPYHRETKNIRADVAIVGIPWDGGTSYRPGARFAPRSVRQASALCRNYHPEHGVAIYDTLRIVDAGDIAIQPIRIDQTFKAIEKRITEIHSGGTRTISIGGDHSVLLPELRAIQKKYGKPTLIHFDAHTDTADQAWGEKYHHGTPIRRAIEEGLIEGKRVFQIGIRGPWGTSTQDEFDRKHKINQLDMNAFANAKKRDAFFKNLLKTAGNGPCFITFDVDGVDPAYAPGTGTPVVGGMTSREALESVRALRGINLVGADVVEISPAYDHAEITSLLGAALVFEFLSLMAIKKIAKTKLPR